MDLGVGVKVIFDPNKIKEFLFWRIQILYLTGLSFTNLCFRSRLNDCWSFVILAASGSIRESFLLFLLVAWSTIEDQPSTRTVLEGITTIITMTPNILSKQMTLITHVNNTTNNKNQQKDMRKEPIRVLRGRNNCVIIAENLSSEEGKSDEEEIVDHGSQINRDYRVKADIS